MPRRPRIDIANNYYHCINRANARLKIFFDDEDYKLFEKTLIEASEIFETRILVYCIMPNHFHLVIQTTQDNEVADFMRWLTLTHTQRWHRLHKTTGSGHLYQGRYKSFVIEDEEHLLTVFRYVERNPIKANLVRGSLDWKWSSLYKRYSYKNTFLYKWPIKEPDNYIKDLLIDFSSVELNKIEKYRDNK